METRRKETLQRPSVLLVLMGLITMLSIKESPAQEFRWPEEPENLQVLPDEAKGGELGAMVRSFASALGVRCQYCHVGKPEQELKPFDLSTFPTTSAKVS